MHRERLDVATEGAEQLFLGAADPASGIQDDDADTRNIQKGACHRGTGIAGCGRQYCHRLATTEPRQALGHEPGAKVLEGQRRSMKQLERIGVADRYNRRLEGKGGRDHLIYFALGKIGVDEWPQHGGGASEPGHGKQCGGIEPWYGAWMKQTLV